MVSVKYLIDADLPRALYTGLKRVSPHIDVVRVQQVDLARADDPTILEFAAGEDRLVVSRDKATMSQHAADRVTQGKPMPGLLLVRPNFARRHGQGLRVLIEELVVIAECSETEEWSNLIQFVPFGID